MSAAAKEKMCDICKFSTGDDEESTLFFGKLMQASNITAHYYCLLLSTNLPQNGEEYSGILGFLLKDIRREIAAAAHRNCCYCDIPNASICCSVCKDYFHIVCGKVRNCLHQFHNQYLSFCDNCINYDEISKYPKTPEDICYICKRKMCFYNPVEWIHAGSCCGNGYVHRVCMLRYAYSAGYYLKCIWCKSPEFRNHVRMRGIFVPDRDASWEREGNAFHGLHRGHQRCDMDVCVCPKGRDYITNTANGKWNLILCELCGSFGAHNPKCIPGKIDSSTAVKTFKCNTCIGIEKDTTMHVQANNTHECSQQSADGGLYVTKLGSGDDIINDDDLINEQNSLITVVTKGALSPAIDDINIDLCTPELLSKSNAESLPRKVQDEGDMVHKSNANFADDDDDRGAISEQALLENCAQTQQGTNKSNISTEMEEHLIFVDDDDGTTSNSLKPTIQNTTTKSQEFSDINLHQSPVITSTIHDAIEENWVIFETYEIVNDDCIGMCTVRINLESPRFVGRTLREIQETETFTGEDIIERRLGERGIFDTIDRILERGFP